MSCTKKSKSTASDVWDLYAKKNNNLSQCNLCRKIYKTGGGTTNLKNHLIRKHPSRFPCKPRASTSTHTNISNKIRSRSTGNQRLESMDLDPELESTYSDRDDPDDVDLSSTLQGQDEENDPESETSASGPNILSPKSSCSSSGSFYTQPSIKSAFKIQQSFEPGGDKDASITQALLYMICKDNLPLSCTEKSGMKRFLKTTVPLYKPPSRKKVTSLVEQKYATMHSMVAKVLSNIHSIAITTDIATVMNATRSFIVLTAHYIDEDENNINSLCLGVKDLTPHHTAVNISEDLHGILFDSWKIEKSKIVSATTDNGANIVAGIRLLLSSDVHVSCFAHNLNLVVTKALGADSVKDLVKIIEKVKNVVAYFKHSNVAQDDLRAEQRKEGKTDGTFLYLIQEVPTRWNSTFHCLQRFMLLSGYVGKILLSPHHKKAPPMLIPQECSEIEEVLQLLSPFDSATTDISGDKYVGGSLVIPLINCLRTSLSRIKPSSRLSTMLKTELGKQVEKKLDPLEKNLLLAAATILDPRFKKIHFKSPMNVANGISFIKSKIQDELGLQVSTTTENPSSTGTESKSTEGIWGIHDEVAASTRQSDLRTTDSGGLPKDFRLYLEQGVVERGIDPITYWTEKKNAYPAFVKVALKYLTILGASVASERVVSLLNNICCDNRSRLTPTHVNQLVFLNSLSEKFWNI